MDHTVMALKIVDVLLDVIPDTDVLNRTTDALLALFQAELDDCELAQGVLADVNQALERDNAQLRAQLKAEHRALALKAEAGR